MFFFQSFIKKSNFKFFQAVPDKAFECPFDQKTLKVNIEKLQKPSLEASWSEHILSNPIKPRMFPHIAIPLPRRSFDPLSQSLLPDNPSKAAVCGRKMMTGSKLSNSFASSCGFRLKNNSVHNQDLSNQAAGQTTTNPLMNASVDRLFEEGEVVDGFVTSQQLQQIQQEHKEAEDKSCSERFEKIDEESEKGSHNFNGEMDNSEGHRSSAKGAKQALDSLGNFSHSELLSFMCHLHFVSTSLGACFQEIGFVQFDDFTDNSVVSLTRF